MCILFILISSLWLSRRILWSPEIPRGRTSPLTLHPPLWTFVHVAKIHYTPERVKKWMVYRWSNVINFIIFWKLRKRPFKWCVAIQNFVRAQICHFSTLDHGLLFTVSPNWYRISQILLLMRPFELFFSKLSENPKKFNIGSTEFKLWQPKESLNHWMNGV